MKDCLQVCFVGLAIRGNCVCCLSIVVIFVGFEGAKESGGESFKVVIWGGNASHKEGQFLWERGVPIM